MALPSKAKPLYRDVLMIGLRPEDLLTTALRREFSNSVTRMIELGAVRRARRSAREAEEKLATKLVQENSEVEIYAEIPVINRARRIKNGTPHAGLRSLNAALRGSNLFGTVDGGLCGLGY